MPSVTYLLNADGLLLAASVDTEGNPYPQNSSNALIADSARHLDDYFDGDVTQANDTILRLQVQT